MESNATVNATTSGTLKRRRSQTTTNVPTLPKIKGDILIQVLTHKSLRRANESLPEEFDNGRLSELGEKVLEAAITVALFNRRPVLTSKEISEQRKHILSDESYDVWVTNYGLRDRVRCLPELISSLILPEETKSLFHAYVGGVYAEGGLESVQKWIDRLLNKDGDYAIDADGSGQGIAIPSEPSGPPPYPQHGSIHSTAQKRMKSESPVPTLSSPTFFGVQPHPSPSPSMMPSSSATYPNFTNNQFSNFQQQQQGFSNPLAPAQPNLAFLPLFNQTASQRRVSVEYFAHFSGPSHAGRWTAQCVVNGIPKGVGTGGTKQVAKEEAARQAFYAMGWS